MTVSIQEAAQKRAAAAERGGAQARTAIPDGVTRRRSAPMACEMRAGEVTKDGMSFLQVTGYASTYDQKYKMWDWAGEYQESVGAGAGSRSLAANPDTVFLENHAGRSFARTTSSTLILSEDSGGLISDAFMNPKRQDAQDLWQSVDDESVTEMSFAFNIVRGSWTPDYTEYRIDEYDIDRGDTSVVTFGANPNTSVEARAAQFELRAEVMRFLRSTEGPELAAAREVLVEQVAASIGAKAAEDLRHLLACVEQDSMGPLEKATLAAVLQRAVDGSLAEALAGESSLAVLLDVAATPAVPEHIAPAPFLALSVDFLAGELDIVRELPA